MEFVFVFCLFLLGEFSTKVGREDICKQTIRNESLHKISNGNGVRAVNFVTAKNLTVESRMFLHHNIHKFTWMSPNGKARKQIDHIVMLATIWWWEMLAVNKQGLQTFNIERFSLKN
jgi:hypothetical protein